MLVDISEGDEVILVMEEDVRKGEIGDAVWVERIKGVEIGGVVDCGKKRKL